MYPNLRAELARRDWTITRLSEETNIPFQRLTSKINGKNKRGIALEEAISIKTALNVDMSLEELFSKEI